MKVYLAKTSVEIPLMGTVYGFYVLEDGKIHVEPNEESLKSIERTIEEKEKTKGNLDV